MDVDTLIHADWVVTVDAQDRVLSQHSLAITQGRIAVIAPRTETYGIKARETIKLTGHALIPGLINAHTHAAMSLLRGLADDLPLMTWLQDHIWPAEGRWANADFVHDGTQLALLEMLRGGTTCFNDMYFFPDVTAELVNAAGMRASIGLIIVDFPSVWAKDATNYFAKGCTVHDRFAQHPRIRTTLAPHAPYSVSNSSLIQVATLAEELDVQIHIHLHETQDEIQQSVKTYGLRPLARLQKLGIVSPRLIAVHMTQLEAYEIELLATYACHVVHCPESNLKLASGMSPVAEKLFPGKINCALGTDGVASNNDLNILGEMRTAALLAKGITGNASALPAATALRMATINGARALGLDAEIGSLEIGKAADIVAVDLSQPETQPLYQPVSQIVYACSRAQVRHVWVAGNILLRDRLPLYLNTQEIMQRAHQWGERIAKPRTVNAN